MADRPVDLGWLRILAEVGRLGSLSSAADVLGLTQPAVSYQIRRLEEQTGVRLLQRQHRGVELTAEGRRLFDAAARAVGEMDSLVASFRGQAGRPAIRLKTDYAFSSLWLIPRMHAFRQLYPEVDIQIVAAQRMDQALPDADDVAVVFGTRNDFGAGGILLLPERVVPVCTRAFLERNGPFDTPKDLASARLIHLDTRGPSPWFDWSSYLAELGISRDATAGQGELSFNTYSLVVQAAISEQGTALGWIGLVDTLISSNVFVTAGPVLEAKDRGYWLIPPKGRSAQTEKLVAWLKSEAEA